MSFTTGRLLLLCGLLAFSTLTGALRAQDDSPPPAARAPLGATPQQIGELYGKVLKRNARVRRHQILEPSKVLEGGIYNGDLYSRNGLIIRVVFHADLAVLLEYTRVEGPLTAQDATLLLAANANTSTWEPGKENTETSRFYRRSDGKAVAHYLADNDGSLLIAAENVGGSFYNDRIMEGH